MALYGQCRAGTQINFPESGCGLGHVIPKIFGSTVGYPSDSLASCFLTHAVYIIKVTYLNQEMDRIVRTCTGYCTVLPSNVQYGSNERHRLPRNLFH